MSRWPDRRAGKRGGLAIAKDGVPVAMLWKPTGSAVTPPTGFAKRSCNVRQIVRKYILIFLDSGGGGGYKGVFHDWNNP